MKHVQHWVQKSGDIAGVLLAHYDMHARTLPWRMPPNGALPDPYRVWLSEIMLQQTTVTAVIPYFERFTARWPDFNALAGAKDADVMAAWAGLGYYARARNLLNCARVVTNAHGGQLPETETELLRLPGIGPYTAAAIAAIAFGRRAVVMDANVERVVSRLFVISDPLPGARTAIYAATDSITPAFRSGDFAQAMMDLGAGYCSARSPSCSLCPISAYCDAAAQETAGLETAGQKTAERRLAEAYPVKAPKKVKPVRQGTAYWIEHDGQVLLVQRPDKGLLSGMRALPDDGWSARQDGGALPPFKADWRVLELQVRHVFTHFTLEMRIAVTEGSPQSNLGQYWPINSLDKAGLPTLFSKIAVVVIAEKHKGLRERAYGTA
jgi:A/G-specific adenine glycosylase